MPILKFRNLTLPRDISRQYVVAGAVLSLSTNSEAIHAAMLRSFAQTAEPVPNPDVSMRLVVEANSQSAQPWPNPYFRGLDHLVFAGFDSESELLIDLRSQRIIGRLSPSMAAGQTYLRAVFPAIFGIVSQTIRITPLHCACVAWKARGLLLAGDSGSGKSTLSLALAQVGWSFISDDWTYLSRRDRHVLAWRVNNCLKLLPDAVDYFPELGRSSPIVSMNGELAYELEPEALFGIQRSPCAKPCWLIFLQREEGQDFNLTKMASAEAAARLEQGLEEMPDIVLGAREFLVETIRNLVELPCWQLRYGAESPRMTAERVLQFLNPVH